MTVVAVCLHMSKGASVPVASSIVLFEKGPEGPLVCITPRSESDVAAGGFVRVLLIIE
jgi:hypothetical protein